MPRFLDHGMIRFIIDKAAIECDPHVVGAERAGSTISARLLTMDRAVVPARARPMN